MGNVTLKINGLLKLTACGLIFLFLCDVTGAQRSGPMVVSHGSDLTSMDIEDLMNVHVTSVAKEDQKMSQVAAAVFVIGREDILRSGATNIPDLLRMVPGLNVAQINSNTWAISARGFNSEFADKLLVLVDGEAVYTPTFAEVYWDTLDVPLEDIDRIEVIRGPGGTVWGNNAVNGVINIITKEAKETQGMLVTGGGGTREQGFGTVQYGGELKDGTDYRIYTKYFNRDHFPDLNGQDGADGSDLLRGGFRADSRLSRNDTLTSEGTLYTGSEGASIVHSDLSLSENPTVLTRAHLSGGDILSRWNHTFSSSSDLSLQVYFNRYTRSGPESHEVRNTVEFDFKYHLALGSRNDLTWGAGYRHTADQTVGTIDQAFIPANDAGELFNFFVQDQITLKPDRLYLYVGTKVENNYFTGFDVEPSVRLAWSPNNRETFWAAVSDAHRAPSRRDVGLSAALAALPGPAEVLLTGDPNFKDEVVWTYEAGYRTQVNKRLSLDLATYINDYHNLENVEPQSSFLDTGSNPPILIIPMVFANNMYGVTGGVEASVRWKLTDRWTISPDYSLLKIHLHVRSTSLDTNTPADTEGSNPSHQAQIRSHVDLPRGFGWDASLYFVSALPMQAVPSYTRLDSQFTWRFAERAQFSIVGQNLLLDHHLEFNDDLAAVNPSQVKRSVYARIMWQF
jgi:iron complex outermembrane recepter protein